ncbi:MAG TPA: error-prone DNA polymerase [Longimicrobiaceae bacterium]|nr:error-prone DNA polymerase [Longimicrobiaceae bacterium]
MSYVELRARSAFSFGDGVLTPEALVRGAAEMGYAALALTDAADLGGIVRFAQEARERQVRPVVGAEVRVGGYPLALLARDEAGYRNLSALVTLARRGNPRGKPALRWGEVLERAAGLHLLTGPLAGEVASLLRRGRRAEAERLLARLREAFGRHLAVEVQLHHVSGAEAALAGALVELAERFSVPWVVTNEPRYLDDDGRLVHDLMTALRAGVDVDTAARRGLLLPNGEWRLRSPEEMAVAWKGREEGVEESARIVEGCGFDLRWLRPPLPNSSLPPGHTEDSYLRELVYAGARERWGGEIGPAQQEQIHKELEVIRRLGFAGFFLVMRKAVEFARDRGIMCQGRGSAANSVVAFCLKITAVDPVRNGLLFERFLSEARTDGETEAPDIDMDFEMHRREEVLDYIYDLYGREHAAITAVTQVYHAPSALQDMMRALGYPPELALPISKRIHRYDPAEGAEVVGKELGRRFGLNTEDARGRALLDAMRTLQDVPRMRSTHPGGFVLSSAPLGAYMPIEETTLGRTILQFDKDDLDVVVVPKFDFLGLGGLTAVRLSFDALERRVGRRLDLYDLPEDDEKTFEMIRRGETLGTFQIESRAQIQSILQTQPENLYDLVVQVALVRPGPIQGEFVGPYTRRRRGVERWEHDHPKLAPILDRTRGIPIFQEQAMSIAMALGGYTPAEADDLRRTMGHVRKQARLEEALRKLRERFVANGLSEDLAERLIRQMRGFGNYGFPESHAWSFALIAYATAWLKANHPAEFLYGLLNAWPMGFYPLATLVHDARRGGVEVRGPCLRRGEAESTLEDTADPGRPAVRIGWRHIHGIGERTLEALRDARTEAPFRSVEDVVHRAGLKRAEALHLARAGAFEAFEPGRRRAAWEALRAAGDVLPLAPARRLPFDPREMRGAELVFLDYLATGVCTHGHPMEHLRPRLRAAGILSSQEVQHAGRGEIVLVAGLVVARQHPQTAKGTVFVLLEDEQGFVNVIVPARLYEKNRETVRFSTFLIVEGKFERNEAVTNVVGRAFRELKQPAISYRSHDFH